MKGVALQINPQAIIVDISHSIAPQDVMQGAFVLGSAYQYFPVDSVHVAVVDPGVGTHRRAVLLVTEKGQFLAPDNGLLTYVLRNSPEYRTNSIGRHIFELIDVDLPTGFRAYNLTRQHLWRSPLSDTFHGRDIFAPVASHLSLGMPAADVGEPLCSLVCLCVPYPEWRGYTLTGHVIHMDRFGNLITTIEGQSVAEDDLEVFIKGKSIQGLSRSYNDGTDLLAVVGSHGNVEISVRNGSAAHVLDVKQGDEVVVELLRTG